MSKIKRHKVDTNNYKLSFVVIVLSISFYFLNAPQGKVIKYLGRITECNSYQFLRETGKEMTVKLDNGKIKFLKFHKCKIGKRVSIKEQKRLLTRQHVYSISYM